MTGAVRLIPGGLHRDHRGVVRHVNAFDFAHVERFYCVEPAVSGELRGWVGHRRDWKWFFAARGRFTIGVVAADDWSQPSRALAVGRFELSADLPQVLEVPPGYFTATVAGDPDAILVVFSSGKIEQAHEDDFRQPPDYWPLIAPRDHAVKCGAAPRTSLGERASLRITDV